jgi:hypothetical protein
VGLNRFSDMPRDEVGSWFYSYPYVSPMTCRKSSTSPSASPAAHPPRRTPLWRPTTMICRSLSWTRTPSCPVPPPGPSLRPTLSVSSTTRR